MINLNGKILAKKALISSDNRAFKYGDSVFDVLKCVCGEIHFWEDHYLRLMATMRIMRMEIPVTFTMDYLQDQILFLLNENHLHNKTAQVRISVFRKEGGDYKPTSMEVDFLIEAQELDAPFYSCDSGKYEVDLFKDFYLQSDLLSTLKITARPVQIVGSVYAQENGYDNCLLLNQHKNVVGALDANLFLVFGNQLKTPPLSEGCLNGIIRKNILKIVAKSADLELTETTISPFELQKADEIFLTNSLVGIQSVTHYRKKTYSTKVAQQLIGKLNLVARLGQI